jgi:aryl-alcohol dehydrogenase-like predicted oxidoreductase
MRQRQVGPFDVSEIGLGCMNLSHAYGTPPSRDAARSLLHRALDLGVTFFDTAALYGFGANETLLGEALAPHRHQFTLASKCGMTGVNGTRVIDGRPETLKRTCEDSLQRLRTDVIDLYYLHRWDRQVPIEDSVGALADLVRAGKVRSIGLSEVSAATLRRAYAVHPIAAVQSEYSLWTRNPEIAVMQACKELSVALVAFSPLGRGFLTGHTSHTDALDAKDIRRAMPRFSEENFSANQVWLNTLRDWAREAQCSPAQMSLAWLLAQGDHVVPIPGTTQIDHLEENLRASELLLDEQLIAGLGALVNHSNVVGARYSDATQREIDTEEFEITASTFG